MSRYKMSRKTARARKSMKMGADDLQEMVKAAVKEALDEQKAEDGSEDDPEESGGDLGEILDAAIEAVNAKRKSAKSDELNPDDTEELVGAFWKKLERQRMVNRMMKQLTWRRSLKLPARL